MRAINEIGMGDPTATDKSLAILWGRVGCHLQEERLRLPGLIAVRGRVSAQMEGEGILVSLAMEQFLIVTDVNP